MAISLAWAAEIFEAVVAVVNDEIITLHDYKKEYDSFYQMLQQQAGGADFSQQFEQIKEILLDNMVTDLLLLQEAKKLGLNVDEQVDMTIQNIKETNNIQSDTDFIRLLNQQGLTYENFRERIKEDIMKQGLIYTQIESTIVLNDSELFDYYKKNQDNFIEKEEYSLKGIYISIENRGEEEARTRMDEVMGRLDAGEDFSELATQYSDGPEKDSQGDLGSFKKGDLAAELEEAVQNKSDGEITDWIKVSGGWYLLKLAEKKAQRMKTFDEVRKEIEGMLYNQLLLEKRTEYLKNLKSSSYIKILIPQPYEYF